METVQMQIRRFPARRQFLFGVSILVLLAALITLATNSKISYGAQIFRAAVWHGAANRHWNQPYPPSFDDTDYGFPFKIRIPAPLQRHAGPLDPPGTGMTDSDSELFFGGPFASSPMQHVYNRVFQYGYCLGWNWLLCVTLFLALLWGGLFHRKRLTTRQGGKAVAPIKTNSLSANEE